LGVKAVESFDIGIGDNRVSGGDHICALYSAPAERDALLGPYVRSALRSGDKCICVLNPSEATRVRELATIDDDQGGDVDIVACSASRQLEVFSAPNTYLRSGRFSATESIALWKASIASAMNGARYPHVRTIGDASFSTDDVPGWRDIAQFEAGLNNMVTLYPQVMLCMYDMQCLDGAFLVDVVSYHPKVLINNMLVENPYYLLPEDWLNLRGG
jgi:hypothetical protein